jgi:hypothetical protein
MCTAYSDEVSKYLEAAFEANPFPEVGKVVEGPSFASIQVCLWEVAGSVLTVPPYP